MLQEFGLTETEEKVYLALAKLGIVKAASIIKKTQLHRTTIYDVLGRLIKKGYVSCVVENKVKKYSINSPDNILNSVVEEREKIDEKELKAKKIVEKIESFQARVLSSSKVQVFTGNDSRRILMRDILKSREDFFILGAGGTSESKDKFFTKQWAEKRHKYNIRAKILAAGVKKLPVWDLNDVRYLPKSYASPTKTTIYGGKIAITIYENPILIILIENVHLAETYKRYFMDLWKIAKS